MERVKNKLYFTGFLFKLYSTLNTKKSWILLLLFSWASEKVIGRPPQRKLFDQNTGSMYMVACRLKIHKTK